MNAVVPMERKASLVTKFASKYSIEPDRLLSILKATAFKVPNGQEVSHEQMAALLVVADQHGLSPFTKEIYAFPDKKNGIVPVVGVDGWSRIINEHPQSDGIEFIESEEIIKDEAGKHKPCPAWIECVIYRKDRARPIKVREHFDESYRAPFKGVNNGREYETSGPWQTHTKRMLRHKALIQAARLAYGFTGIYDEDEAQRIIEIPAENVRVEETRTTTRSGAANLKAAATKKKDEPPTAATPPADVTLLEEVTARAGQASNADEIAFAQDLARGLESPEDVEAAGKAIAEAQERLGLRE